MGEKCTYNAGRGTWREFDLSLDVVFSSAIHWKEKLKNIDKCWLCWNVDSDWCFVQQQLIEEIGWIPVVGYDPRCGPPKKTTNNAIVIDFNESFGFPKLFPHFVLEFVFLYCKKMAFWHSDLLLKRSDMQYYSSLFDQMQNGDFAAVRTIGGIRNLLQFNKHRYWELLGCTTEEASKSQYENGCGWWRHFYLHPNYSKNNYEKKHWEYGCGIMEWKRKKILRSSNIYNLSEKKIKYGHFTRIGNENYVENESSDGRNLNKELSRNYNLELCCKKLSIIDLFYLNP